MPSEDLVINMRANDQLSVTLKKVGQAAEDAGKSIQKVTASDVKNFGASMLRGASELATGLYGLSKASSALVEQQNFVKQVFGSSAPAIEKFARGAAESMGLSTTAALKAAASIGIFGRAVGMQGPALAQFSTGLAQLAGDMASIKDTPVTQAVTAISAAFRSQYRPIKEYGVVLNEEVLKHRALSMEIYDGTGKLTQQQKVLAIQAELYHQLDFAMGDFQRTSGTLANQTRIAQANFENLKASLGDSLRPAFISVTKTANDAMQMFMKLPQPVKDIAANVALVGTGMLALGGGVLFAVGKVGEMINSFQQLRSKMQAIQQSGSGVQKAMLGLGKAAAGLGLVAAGSQIAFDAINSITGVAEKASTAVQKLNVALASGKKNDAWSSFLDIAKAKDDALTFSHLWTDAGKKIQLMGSDTKRPIEDLDAAFKELLNQNPAQAAQVLNIMKEQANALDKNSGQYKDNQMLIERWGKQLDLSVASQQASTVATQDANDALDAHKDPALEAMMADEEAQKAADELAASMEKLAESVTTADKAFDTAKERADAFNDALQATTGLDEGTKTVIGYKDAIASLAENWKDADGKIKDGATSLDINTTAGRDNLKAIDDVATAMSDHLINVYKDSGGSINAVTDAQKAMVSEFDDTLRAAGVSEDAIAAFNDTLNETPRDVEVAIRLQDQEIAMKKLEMLNLEMDKLPDDISTQITAEMDEGDFLSAYQLASNFVNERPLDYGMRVDDPTTAIHEGLNTAQSVADSNPVDVPTEVKAPTNQETIWNGVKNFFGNNKPTTEVDVKEGDIKTPQGRNIQYAKTNKPETTIETLPGDYTKAWGQIDSFMKSHNVQIKADVVPGDYWSTWAAIFGFYLSHPVTTMANVAIGNMGGAWGAIWAWYASHPVTVQVNADTGNISAAWNQIQQYFNSHPISVKVNTVQGTVAPPAVPGATATGRGVAARPDAPAESGAMTAMGLVTASDGTLLAAPAPVSAGRPAPTGTPSIINLNVNMAQGTNEAKVIDLLKRYQRANGTRVLPRG
jgi:hypothetical protein